MYVDLYEYLVLYKSLNVPGIGTFMMERKPAETDFTHKQIHAPGYRLSFQHADQAPPVKTFFYWLADKWNIPFHEAIVRFNGFAIELKNQVLSGNIVSWNELGTLTKGVGGEIIFEPLIKERRFDPSISAVRIIRDKAEHSVRVGEQEKTSAEMTEWLNQTTKKRSYWWKPALVATILLVILTSVYFFQQGCNASSTANQQKLSPKEQTVTHQTLP